MVLGGIWIKTVKEKLSKKRKKFIEKNYRDKMDKILEEKGSKGSRTKEYKELAKKSDNYKRKKIIPLKNYHESVKEKREKIAHRRTWNNWRKWLLDEYYVEVKKAKPNKDGTLTMTYKSE